MEHLLNAPYISGFWLLKFVLKREITILCKSESPVLMYLYFKNFSSLSVTIRELKNFKIFVTSQIIHNAWQTLSGKKGFISFLLSMMIA